MSYSTESQLAEVFRDEMGTAVELHRSAMKEWYREIHFSLSKYQDRLVEFFLKIIQTLFHS